MRWVVHRFEPNHLGRSSVHVGQFEEIPVGSHYRVRMVLCEITDDLVGRFALKAELSARERIQIDLLQPPQSGVKDCDKTAVSSGNLSFRS